MLGVVLTNYFTGRIISGKSCEFYSLWKNGLYCFITIVVKQVFHFIFVFQTYRISVRTVTTNDEESSDRSAVVTIGKGRENT